MSEQTICDQCGSDLPADAPDGSCPNCLLGLAMNAQPSIAGAGSSLAGAEGEYSIPAADQLIGKFPNIEIEHLIGRGGMGAVYKACQTNLDRTVALKILSPRLGSDPTFAERFTREARTLAKLTHPNIVTVFDFGCAENIHYLVMEHVDGINLRDAIQLGRIQPDRALEIIQQICDALQYAHDSGIIHRDIKPENILIDRLGHVKIADFGLAKLLQPDAADFTLTGTRQVLGTLSYMAPEQIEHPQTVDHRADLYSLGVVFYELLTGELPIGRFSAPSRKSRCSSGLDEVVFRTLEKEPDRRYQQASELKTAVDQYDDIVANSGGDGASAFSSEAPASASSAVSTLPISTSVPFTIREASAYALPDFIAGILPYRRSASGIMVAYEDRIQMETETYNLSWLGIKKAELKNVSIPFADLSSIEFEKRTFTDRIRIQANSIGAMYNVPGSSRGGCTFYTEIQDRRRAESFAAAANRVISARNPGETLALNPPSRPVKGENTSHLTEEEIILIDERMKVPRIALFIISILQMLGALGSLAFACSYFVSPPRVYYSGDAEIAFLISLGCLAASILLFFVSRNMKAKLNYHFVIASLIVLLILPANPTIVLQWPFVIWAFVVVLFADTRQLFYEETLETRKRLIRQRLGHTDRMLPTENGNRKKSKLKNFLLPAIIIAIAMGVMGYQWTENVSRISTVTAVDVATEEGATSANESVTVVGTSSVESGDHHREQILASETGDRLLQTESPSLTFKQDVSLLLVVAIGVLGIAYGFARFVGRGGASDDDRHDSMVDVFPPQK